MRSLFLALLLIGALALVGTTTALNDDFQNGADAWLGYEDDLNIHQLAPLSYTAPYDDCMHLTTSYRVFPLAGGATNYLSWTHTSVPPGNSETLISTVLPLNGNMQRYFGQGGSGGRHINMTEARANGWLEPYSYRVQVYRQNSNWFFYIGGVLVGETTTGPSKDFPSYIGGTSSFAPSLYGMDDFSTVPASDCMVGIIPSDWYISKDIANPLLIGVYKPDGDDFSNDYFHATYALDDWTPGLTLSIDQGAYCLTALQEFVRGVTAEDSTGIYRPIEKRSGVITMNLSSAGFFNEVEAGGAQYGRHTVDLMDGDEVIASSSFWYKAVATSETSITFDRDLYAPADSIQINTTIGTNYWQQAGLYSYYACLYDPVTNTFRGPNWTIPAKTHTYSTAASTDLFPATGEYLTLLYGVTSTGQEILLDTDSAMVYTNKIVYSGYVYDAQQGTVISGAAVSVEQGGGTLSDTTGSDGRFEITGIEKDVASEIQASATGYITWTTNYTFDEYRRYEYDIALAPTSPAHTGEAIFGTVRSLPLGGTVASPSVALLKDGAPINTTTATDKGWYIFDGLDATTAYTIEVEKEGYLDYSNGVTTGSGGASLTQFDPYLTPVFDLTVNLVDAVSMQPITALMAVSVGGQSEQTQTGTVTFHDIVMGPASVAVVGSGYTANETALSMMEDKEITLYIMPLPVVPTTDIPLTPTPTPALVDMIGTVYDAMTGQPITTATVEVSAMQGGATRTDATDGNGDYSFANIQNGVLTTVNATATGYTHTAFSFTPVGSAEYIVDLYMYRTDEYDNPTIEPDPGLAGAGGTVLGGPYHELVETPTVTASNGTWSGPATLSPDHVWYFTDLEPNQAYNFTASAAGFITQSVQATTGGAGTFTVVPIVLAGVYDVTITIKDADTYALILQPVQLSLSSGLSGNTSTGSYTFTNLEYATYVVSAASEGYTGGGLSFLAYGDHTEYLYLAKAPEGSGSTYEYAIPPKPVEILCRNIFGMPLSGVTVTAQGGETTLPDEDLIGAFFGWGEKYSGVNLANATMTGTTGTDGGITFMMTDALKYNVTFTDESRGISETVELMPHDTQYMFVLGSMSATPAAGMPNMTLWAEGEEGASPTLRGYYSDPAGTTSALYFVVESVNGTTRTEVSNQSLGAVQTASPSFAVNHTSGAMYSWGFRATTPDRGALQQWNGITLHSRLVELPIEESAYFWVSMCLVFLFAGLFSGNNIKYGFVAFPMFCGVLWYIGWLNIAGMTLGIVMVLGVLMYLAKVQVA